MTFLSTNIDLRRKIAMGMRNKKPIRHLERSSTNKEELRSRAVFAAVGTTAKHKDDKSIIATPKK